jgi:hypothetical protein
MAKKRLRRIRVPENFRQPLRDLGTLSSDQYQALLRTVAQATPTLSVDDLSADVAERASLDEDAVRSTLGLLMSLSVTREFHGLSLDRLVQDVLSRSSEDLDIQDVDTKERLSDRLQQLLALERPIGVSARALGVLLEHERAFADARIVTDIRPIFLAADSLEPVATVLIHNLKLVSHTADTHTEHFFALDTGDLRALRDVIDRALEKEEALERVIRTTNLTYLAFTE